MVTAFPQPILYLDELSEYNISILSLVCESGVQKQAFFETLTISLAGKPYQISRIYYYAIICTKKYICVALAPARNFARPPVLQSPAARRAPARF